MVDFNGAFGPLTKGNIMVKAKVKSKKSIKPQVMPPYGKMKKDGHTSVDDVQDTGYQTVPKPSKRPIVTKPVKMTKSKENVKSGKLSDSKKKQDKEISGTGSKNVDVKSRRIPATMDSKLSSIADKSGYAKKNKDQDKQPKMKKRGC